MKKILNTGIKVCDNKVKKERRHTTNEKPNMYLLDVFNKNNEYFYLFIFMRCSNKWVFFSLAYNHFYGPVNLGFLEN